MTLMFAFGGVFVLFYLIRVYIKALFIFVTGEI